MGSLRHTSSASLLPLRRHGEPLPHLCLALYIGATCTMYTCIHVHVYMYNVHVHMYMYVHQYEVAGIESTVYSMGYKCTCTYNIMLVCAGWRSIAGRCHSS